ncbi:hypothetical protein [Fluviicola sp.]|uniref:hypothetical protein n=1 Tax=Fluviicola sp. TaxID=1917219 RepID=UPI0031CEB5AF
MNHLNKAGQVKILVNVKKPKRFKAGAELSGAVNLQVEEGISNGMENLQIQLTIDPSSYPDDDCGNEA